VVRKFGCVITRAHDSHVQVHHVEGACAKHGKVWIGQWYVLPLHWQFHDPGSNHKYHVGHSRKAFEDKYGHQAELFVRMCQALNQAGFQIPPPLVTHSIVWYRKTGGLIHQ
jgi:hypothetical protein